MASYLHLCFGSVFLKQSPGQFSCQRCWHEVYKQRLYQCVHRQSWRSLLIACCKIAMEMRPSYVYIFLEFYSHFILTQAKSKHCSWKKVKTSVSRLVVGELPCGDQRASFIHAATHQLILTLGLWTGVREVQLEGEVQIEAGDGNVRTGVRVYFNEFPVTLNWCFNSD